MLTALRLVASLLIGLGLLIPLGALYGSANLPVYHSWGLSHGSFTTAIPALVAASYVALGLVPKLGPPVDTLPRLLACATVFALVTTLFWIDQYTDYAFSVWHVITYAVLLIAFFVLCLQSSRPWLIPLFLLVPLLLDPLFGLAINLSVDSVSIELFAYDLVRKILPAATATLLAALLASMIRRSKP